VIHSAKFPASVPDGGEDHESVAKSLIEKLGLYDELPASPDEESEVEADVESE
jgi:hypothetical protein